MTEHEEKIGQIINKRQGNFSQVTHFNQQYADLIMSKSALRPNIIIQDSDSNPEEDTIAVSSDTLAMRSIAPLSSLFQKIPKRDKLYVVKKNKVLGDINDLNTDDDELQTLSYTVIIHERALDRLIRRSSYQDLANYQIQYLTYLNKVIKSALGNILYTEKISPRKLPGLFWLEAGTLAGYASGGNHEIYSWLLTYVGTNVFGQGLHLVGYSSLYNDRNLIQALLYPLFPIEDYLKGVVSLLRSDQLIIMP